MEGGGVVREYQRMSHPLALGVRIWKQENRGYMQVDVLGLVEKMYHCEIGVLRVVQVLAQFVNSR